jgi:hypothetical protein
MMASSCAGLKPSLMRRGASSTTRSVGPSAAARAACNSAPALLARAAATRTAASTTNVDASAHMRQARSAISARTASIDQSTGFTFRTELASRVAPLASASARAGIGRLEGTSSRPIARFQRANRLLGDLLQVADAHVRHTLYIHRGGLSLLRNADRSGVGLRQLAMVWTMILQSELERALHLLCRFPRACRRSVTQGHLRIAHNRPQGPHFCTHSPSTTPYD